MAVKIVSWEPLVDSGGYSRTTSFQTVVEQISQAVSETVWPPGSDKFTIRPESGKKRGMGNGVRPIKAGFVSTLKSFGWSLEEPAPRAKTTVESVMKGSRPGAFDCHYRFPHESLSPFVVEWETGNVSSSHRALNRIGLGILKGYISGGVLIVPSGKLYPYLTDRIGNEPELRPYHPLWREWTFSEKTYLAIIAVEHDEESLDVARIPKGTDGRAEN